MPMRSDTPDDKAAFWETIRCQIPAYVGWLRFQFKAPEHLRIDSRTGVDAYKHKELLSEIATLAPEMRLLALIDNAIMPTLLGSDRWTGTAEQLSMALCTSAYGFEAKHLLDWPNACGTYLGRLRSKYPDRFLHACKGDARVRTWTILPAA